MRFASLVAGGIDSCGVAVDGKAYCWGSPQEGRLGTGAADAANKSADKTVPTAVAGEIVFATVMPRAWHTCGLSSMKAVFCWGGNMFQMESAVPKLVADIQFTVISTGLFHDCALARDEVAYCWGQNTDGELGRWHDTRRSRASTRRDDSSLGFNRLWRKRVCREAWRRQHLGLHMRRDGRRRDGSVLG